MVLVLNFTVIVILYIIIYILYNNLKKLWNSSGITHDTSDPIKKIECIYLQNVNSKMFIPRHFEKDSIQIINTVLIFQILFLKDKFSIEVGVTDNSNIKKKFIFSTSLKTIDKGSNIKIPLKIFMTNIWTNLYIDFSNLITSSFANKTIKCIDYIIINGLCKVRKIFAIKNISILNKLVFLKIEKYKNIVRPIIKINNIMVRNQ